MTQNTSLPKCRKPSRGVHISLSESTIVWLTVCTKDRIPWLACDEAHQHLVMAWTNADAWVVGRYILMPDHLHLFCSPNHLDVTMLNWVRYWKSSLTRMVQNPGWRWQPGCWDTRLRRHESYSEKWMYSEQNPVRAGLVNHAKDWPYQGELNKLRW